VSYDEIRQQGQKLLQESAELSRQSADKQAAASEIFAQLAGCTQDKTEPTIHPPEQSDARTEIPFEHLGDFYQPKMPELWWANQETLSDVTGYNDGSFDALVKPQANPPSTRIQQNNLLTGTRSYRVEQTVTLLDPFSWSDGSQASGKLGMGLATYEVVVGGSLSKGGGSCRFSFHGKKGERTGKVALYSYDQKRNQKYGRVTELGPLTVGVPTTMKMEVGLNSGFNSDDGWLKG